MPSLSDLGSVTINGYPVLVDVGGEIESYIQQYIPLADIWPGPRIPRSIPPTGTGMDVFESPYPPLPPCEIGQFQWPANMSRYGRALYLVDKDTMTKLATDAWGYVPYDPEAEPPGEGDPPRNTATEPFLYWGQSSEAEVTLELNTPEVYYAPSSESPPQTKIRVKMLMLLPIRITTASHDVWLLRLVDPVRYKNQDLLISPHDPEGDITGGTLAESVDDDSTPSEADDLTSASSSLTISQIARRLAVNFLRMPASSVNVTGMSNPADPCWQWKGNRVLEVLDSLILSTGKRPVYRLSVLQTGDPVCLFVAAAADSEEATRTAILDTERSPLIAGGICGEGAFPRSVLFSVRRCNQFLVSDHFYSYERSVTAVGGIAGVDQMDPFDVVSFCNVHYTGPFDTIEVNAASVTLMETRCNALALQLRHWNDTQHDVVFAGFYRPIAGAGVPRGVVTGFEDYVCFCLRSGSTRYKSLPAYFVPRVHLEANYALPCFVSDGPLFGLVEESDASEVKVQLQSPGVDGQKTFARPFYYPWGNEEGGTVAADDPLHVVYSRNFSSPPEVGDRVVLKRGEDGGWAVHPINTIKLVRFTLTAALAAGGTASATPTGTESSEAITVTDWAGNAGESGDKGIAWKDGSTYWVIEIKAAVDPSDMTELFRFTLTANLAAGGTATATTTPATTTITVTDWAGNPAKSGSKGVAWKDGETYWVIEIERPGPQFITCKLSSGGYSFGGASGTTFNVTDIAGVDAPWTGASTIEVENPLKIKVWMTTCLIKCQFNQATGDWEVIAATQEHVLHGVRINETCVFQQLTYNGAENWNAPTDWDSKTSTSADWVTSVYIIDGSLVYDKRCQEGVVIANLTDCETPPEPPPE
jgi:hypothetical protein